MKGEVKAGSSSHMSTCCACLELLKVPCSLSCSHLVCSSCIQKLTVTLQSITNTNSNNNTSNGENNISVRCPLCHKFTKAQEVKALQEETSKGVVCGLCETASATCECSDCSKEEVLPLCANCSASIHKGKLKSHVVNTLNSSDKKHVPRCILHGKKLMLYCENDLDLICSLCAVAKHKGHNVTPVSMAAKEILPKLREQAGNLPAVQQRLKTRMATLDKCIADAHVEKLKQEEYLHAAISEIQAVLEEARRDVMKKIGDLYNPQRLLDLRTKMFSQISSFNKFHNDGKQLDQQTEHDILRLFCSLPDLSNEEIKFISMETRKATRLEPREVLTGIRDWRLNSLATVATELLIQNRVELDPATEHTYEVVKIMRGGELTSSSSSPLTLNVMMLEIDEGGSIDLSGKGYTGGAAVPNANDGLAHQGASPTGVGGCSKEANGGGGGGGIGSSSFGSTGGGGGGYGSAGMPAAANKYGGGNNPGGIAGNTYGDAALSTLNMGSGGGTGHPYHTGTGGKGGGGGGALRINAVKIVNRGTIKSNGDNGAEGTQFGSGGGGGSGGSIFLQATEFENTGKIEAVGGQGGETPKPGFANICSRGGNGGNGRIRIDVPKNTPMGDIVPQPHVG